MHRLLILFTLVVAVGCDSSSKLSRSLGDLEVSSSALSLPDAFVGYPSRASLEVRNTARGARTARLEVTPPFTLPSDSLEVGGGGSVLLEVSFEPAAAGPVTGTLRLTTDSGSIEVALAGSARPVPQCTPSGPCRTVSFDAAQGLCLEAPLPEGTACSTADACLVFGQCAAGECVGQTRSCDDGDLCTTDACDPVQGCVHLDATASCPAPGDPCRVPRCDPKLGCTAADAPDGTACGAADCISANVCLGGSCRTLPVPEGSVCAAESPCQGKGTCRAQVCERPAPSTLVPAWSYPVPADATLYFNGLTDSLGNLYWAECRPQSCELVSAMPTGFLRYRVPLEGTSRTALASTEPGLLVIVGDTVLSALTRDAVEARRASDGTQLWRTPLQGVLAGPTRPSTANIVNLGPVIDDGHGGLYVRAQVSDAAGYRDPRGDAVVALSATSGALRWLRFLAGPAYSLASDEAGNLYAPVVMNLDGGSFSGLLSLDGTGAERWRATSPGLYGSPMSVAGGRVVVADSRDGLLFDAADGGSIAPPDAGQGYYWYAGGQHQPLLGSSAAYFVGSQENIYCGGVMDCCVPAYPGGMRVSSVALWDATPLWELELVSSPMPYAYGNWAGEAALSTNGDVLFAQGPAAWSTGTDGGPELRAVTSAGQERFTCALPGPAANESSVTYEGATSLSAARWVVVAQPHCSSCTKDPAPELRAFDLPGYDLASGGWSAEGGSNLRAGRPR